MRNKKYFYAVLTTSTSYRKHIPLFVFISLAALNLMMVIVNHYCFKTFAYYYGVYNFAFFDFAHLASDPCPVFFDGTNGTFLQDHVSFLLPALAPVYWLLQAITKSYTLLVIQWAAISFGGWATWKLIAKRTADSLPPVIAMILYFASYSRFSSYHADVNLAIIGAALLPAFVYYFFEGRRWPTLTVFAILLIVREDFSLLLMFICIWLAIHFRKERHRRNFALTMTAASAAAFVLIFAVVVPALESETKKFVLFNYGALGGNPAEAFLSVVTHPVNAFKLLFVNNQGPENDWIKLSFYLVFGLSGGVLLFARPAMLICLVPLLTKKMWNDDPIRWGYETYYAIETVSLLPALIFLVVLDLVKVRRVLTISVGIASISMTAYCFSRSSYPFSFTKHEFFKPNFYHSEYPAREFHKALSDVPADAAVSASGRVLPHLAMRRKIYYFPRIDDAEYVCMSILGDPWPVTNEEYDRHLQELRHSLEWTVIYEKENSIIFKRRKQFPEQR